MDIIQRLKTTERRKTGMGAQTRAAWRRMSASRIANMLKGSKTHGERLCSRLRISAATEGI